MTAPTATQIIGTEIRRRRDVLHKQLEKLPSEYKDMDDEVFWERRIARYDLLNELLKDFADE